MDSYYLLFALTSVTGVFVFCDIMFLHLSASNEMMWWIVTLRDRHEDRENMDIKVFARI